MIKFKLYLASTLLLFIVIIVIADFRFITKTTRMDLPEVSFNAGPSYFSKKDLNCMSDNIYYEARGEGITGMWAVANVVINRLNNHRWPKTVCQVVYQPFQFSWTGEKPQKPDSQKAHQLARLVAGEVLARRHDEGIDLTNGATSFHRFDLEKPTWSYSLLKTKTIGNHTFYKLKGNTNGPS